MHKIVKPGIGKRALVAICDLVIAVFLGLGVFALCQTLFDSSAYATSLKNEINGYQIDSHLYGVDEDGNAYPYTDFATYDKYEERLLYYYTDYLVNSAPEGYRKDYDVYWYNVHVLGLPDAKGLYKDDTILEPGKSEGQALFEYVKEGETPNYDVLAKPKASAEDGKLTPSEKALLLRFYYDDARQNAYYNAGRDLYFSDFFQAAFGNYSTFTNVYPLTIAVFVSAMVFYVVIPLIFANGETLAKKFFHLCVISASGFKVKKGQVVLRQIVPAVALTITFFFVPFVYAVMASSLVFLASYLLAIFTPDNRAIHDYLGYTQVVSETDSVFYASQEEQDKAEAALAEILSDAEERLRQADREIEEERRLKS